MANLGNQKIKDTYQLVLQTDSSGNLQNLSGGTPNPFIVNGNLRYVDGNQANGYVLLSDASGNASWGAVVPGDIYISGGSINGTTIELNTTSGNTVSIPGLSWSSSTSGHISNSGLTGNVGIGTTTPNEKLTVVGDISGTTDLHIGRNITTTNNLTVNGDTLYGNSATGNVGVGNLNPTHKLTISGNTFNLIILAVGQSMVCAENDRRVRFEGGATTESLVAGMQLKIVDGNGITQTVTIDEIVSDYIIYLTVPFPGSDVTATTFRRSTTQNTNQFAVYSGSNIAFQVSGDVVMSGSTDLLDIFASSAITNQDVYWTATTDGTGISPSGSNVTTVVRMSGDTHIKGNLGVSGNTYTTGAFVVGNATLNTSQLDISSGDFTLDVEGDITLDANGADIILSDDGTDFGRFKRDSSDFIIKSEGNNNDIIFRGQDAGVTRDALLLDMSDAGTATFNNGVNISGATSGRTDASFGGNLGISGKTFLDDNLRFSSAKQVEWVDSSTYIQGTTTQLALNGDLNITLLADNQIKMTSTEMTNVGRVGISGDTNINGVLSGLTDARFGGNLGISGKTFLDDDLTVNGKGTFGDLSIETNGSNAILELERDSGGQLKLKAQVTSNRITYEGGPLYIDRDESGTNTLTLGTGGNISAAGDITAIGRAGISGDTNINGTLSGLTDARFGGNLGVTGNTYFNGNISYPNARFFIQSTGGLKLLANDNWVGFNRTTGGLDSSGFWTVDTGSGTVGTAYSYYGSYRNTFFMVPYACKLTRMVIQGANTTNSEVGQDWNINLAKSPVVNDSDSISWTQVTGVTKTLPDDRDKRFIYDISIDQDCAQFDTFILLFQGTNSSDTWISLNMLLEFEYTLT